MSVEAGRDCLRGVDRSRVSVFDLASTTAPFADLQNAVLAGYALSLPKDARQADFSGSTRAGLSALARACNSPSPGDRLIVAADKRNARPGSVQEFLYGAGAGALLVGEGSDLIAAFLGSESTSLPFIDHFRSTSEQFDYFWEERWIRDEGVAKIVPKMIASLLKRLNIAVSPPCSSSTCLRDSPSPPPLMAPVTASFPSSGLFFRHLPLRPHRENRPLSHVARKPHRHHGRQPVAIAPHRLRPRIVL